MKEYTRNVAVGLTVIVALAMLAGMILLFTGLPQFFQRGYPIVVAAEATHDAHVGDVIYVSGLRVGRVTEITFTDPSQPMRGVRLHAKIDEDVMLPPNARLFFHTPAFVGATYLEIVAEGPPMVDPKTHRPLAHFPTDGSVVMEGVHAGSAVIPKELSDSLKGLGKLADSLQAFLGPQTAPATGAATGPTTQPAGLQGTLARLNRALEGISGVVGDEQNRENIRISLANLAEATAAASDAMTELQQFARHASQTTSGVDELTDKLIDDAQRIGELVETINRVAMKMDQGEGTAGRLVNDPDLYHNLVDASRQLSLLLEDLRRLVEQWKADGVNINIK